MQANSGDTDKTPHSAASDLGLALFVYVTQKGH